MRDYMTWKLQHCPNCHKVEMFHLDDGWRCANCLIRLPYRQSSIPEYES